MRQASASIIAVSLILIAGCSGTPQPTTSTESTTDLGTTTQGKATTTMDLNWPPLSYEPTEGPRVYPSAPENLSEEVIQRKVDRYESAYVYNKLHDLENLTSLQVPERGITKIMRQHRDGYLVKTKISYSIERTRDSNATSIYDGESEAIYFINQTSILRIEVLNPASY